MYAYLDGLRYEYVLHIHNRNRNSKWSRLKIIWNPYFIFALNFSVMNFLYCIHSNLYFCNDFFFSDFFYIKFYITNLKCVLILYERSGYIVMSVWLKKNGDYFMTWWCCYWKIMKFFEILHGSLLNW